MKDVGIKAGRPSPVRSDHAGDPWSYRNLIWTFAQREMKARFKGTALGWAWSLVIPIATLVIYSVVFSVIMRMAPPAFGNGKDGIYFVWLFCGLVAWSFFANSLNAGVSGLLGVGALLKKIYFPAYTPIVGSTISTGIQSSIEMGVLVALLAVFGNVGWTYLLIPFWVAIYFVFCASIATIVAMYNVYFRDLAHIVGVILQMLFYLTPIIYPVTLIPETVKGLPLRTFVEWSPFTQFIELFRDLIYHLTPGEWTQWVYVLAVTGVLAMLAIVVVRKRGQDLGEEL